MSNAPPWAVICEQEHSATIDAAKVCVPTTFPNVSPIDEFYDHLGQIVPLGKAEELHANSALGKVLLLGIVSATEHYFRAIISGLIYTCPLVRKKVAASNLSFGAIDYYRREDLGLALLENVSLATAGEVRKQIHNLVGVETRQGSSADAALGEYEKLCQLRHAAVHAHGELGHRNLNELGITGIEGRRALNVGFAALHESADVCQNVVRAYNSLLFRKTIERWMTERLLSGKWLEDRTRFTGAFLLFYARRDFQGTKVAYIAYRQLLPTLQKVLTNVKDS